MIDIALQNGGNMIIYVGNLSLDTTDVQLRQEFLTFGQVMSVSIMNNKYIGSGQSRGYAYVTMPLKSEGVAAITGLKGTTMSGQMIDVVEALPLSGNRPVSFLHAKADKRFGGKPRERKR
jgi:RNA recognition motif-containing protein